MLQQAYADATVGEPIEPPTRLEFARERFGLMSVADWIDKPEPPIEWVVEGLVAKEHLTMLCSFAKGGKSVYGRAMSYAVATGTPFLGMETTQGPVIYAALEEAQGHVRRAFRTLGVRRSTPLHLKFSRGNEHFYEDLRTLIDEIEPSLVVIDTFVRIPRPDKNPETSDYLGNSELLEPLLYIAHETKKKTAVVPLYHSTKAGKRSEGYEAVGAVMSNAGIVASVDQLISIVVQPDDTRGFQSFGRLEPMPITLYSYDRQTEGLAVLGTKEEISHQSVRSCVIEECSAEQWLTTKEIKDAVPHNGAAVSKALKELYEEGMLERDGAGKSNSPFLYRRAESPFSVLSLQQESRIELDAPVEGPSETSNAREGVLKQYGGES